MWWQPSEFAPARWYYCDQVLPQVELYRENYLGHPYWSVNSFEDQLLTGLDTPELAKEWASHLTFL